MIIDFHTHIFPERIAPRAVTALKEGIKRVEGIEQTAYTDATLSGLIRSMDENGVGMSVVMPIVTNPDKPGGVNDYAETLRGGRVVSFGSVHPLQKNAPDFVRRLKERGFAGIKMHPEFQRCYIDSPETLAVLKAAEEEDMLVMVHAGADIGMPPPVHCPPKRLARALEYVSGENIIAAHLGGWRQWGDVYELLAGGPVYMDTAFIGGFIDDDLCRAVIEKHGADKILFGSDSPWDKPARSAEYVRSLSLGSEAEDMIFYKNAAGLLEKYAGV